MSADFEHEDMAEAAALINASGTHVVVPVEPTEAMVAAGAYIDRRMFESSSEEAAPEIYRAMLKASQGDE